MLQADRRPVVMGVGGAGSNAVARLADALPRGARLVASDMSAGSLEACTLGREVVALPLWDSGRKGWGAGGDQVRAADAAEARSEAIAAAIAGARMVFVVAGMAGGTGGGASSVMARVAREAGAVTLGFGIMPFGFEPARRRDSAERACAALEAACDTTVLLDNERAVALAGPAPLDIALRAADDPLRQAVGGLGNMLSGGGWLDVDMSRLRSAIGSGGRSCIALGSGESASHALRSALNNAMGDPRRVLDARVVLVQFTGGPGLTLAGVDGAVRELRAMLAADVEIMVGAASRPSPERVVRVTLVGARLAALDGRGALATSAAAARGVGWAAA